VSGWTLVKQGDNAQQRGAIQAPSGEEKVFVSCVQGPDQVDGTLSARRLLLGRVTGVATITAFTPEKTNTRSRTPAASTLFATAGSMTFPTNPLVVIGTHGEPRLGKLAWWRPPQPNAKPYAGNAEFLGLYHGTVPGVNERYANTLMADEQINDRGDNTLRLRRRRSRRRGWMTHRANRQYTLKEEGPNQSKGITESAWAVELQAHPMYLQRRNWAIIFSLTGTSISASDASGTATETTSLTAAETATDVNGSVEQTSLAAALTGADADSVVTEAASLLFAIALADSGSGADTAILSAVIPISDSGLGTDSAVLVALAAVSDTNGTPVESGLVTLTVTGSDSSSGSDQGLLATGLLALDSSQGTDAGTVQFSAGSSDSGHGTDTGVSSIFIFGTDSSAVASEAATMLTSLIGTDQSQEVEQGALAAAVQAQDTAAALEDVRIGVTGSDASAIAQELARFDQSVSVLDSGGAQDGSIVVVSVNGADIGSALESAQQFIAGAWAAIKTGRIERGALGTVDDGSQGVVEE
jgi:hypothetical protein